MFERKRIKITSPFEGKIVSIEKVPDEVFSKRTIGDGIAVNPSNGVVYAPVSGEVIHISPTYHAFGIKTKEGLEILVHIGIDTVELGGLGFNSYIKEGDQVVRGAKVIDFDLDMIKDNLKSAVCPIVITNSKAFRKIKIRKRNGEIDVGDVILVVK